MVGDGLNDAPSLAAADASLSVATAAHLTQAAADAVFLGDRLAPVVAAVTIARRARRLMRENLALAVGYNAVAVPVAMLGYASPLIAALAMSGSSILVTLNALRANAPARRACVMEVLIYLVPIALGLGLLGLGAFLWALKTGQYDDLEGAAWRALMDDDAPAGERPGGS